MIVTEIFHSIQGESTWVGRPCVFVRLTGCNLRCRWCDTEYAFHGGEHMPVDAVLKRVRELSRRDGRSTTLVELTGGEPMLQTEILTLMERLLSEKFTVLLETSGQRYLGPVPKPVVKIMDIKCPDSGEGESLHPGNLPLLDGKDEVKFVLANEDDYVWAREFLKEYRLHERVKAVNFSPVFGELDPDRLTEWILRDRLPVRLNLQLHKILWDPNTRGV